MVVLIVMMVMAAAVWVPLTVVLGMMVWSQQKPNHLISSRQTSIYLSVYQSDYLSLYLSIYLVIFLWWC